MKTLSLTILITEPEADLLDSAVATGLWGTSQAEAAERLIAEGLRRLDAVQSAQL